MFCFLDLSLHYHYHYCFSKYYCFVSVVFLAILF